MRQIKKTINFDEEMVKNIEELANESERDFSGQVRYMLKKYMELLKK